MKYKIKYNYNTGDSFSHTEGLEDELDLTWENLDIAKENIKRIQEHYKAYEKINGWNAYGKGSWNDYKHERWFNQYSLESQPNENFSIKLLTDEEEEYIESTGSWCGYFESLNYVEIIPDNNDMKIYM